MDHDRPGEASIVMKNERTETFAGTVKYGARRPALGRKATDRADPRHFIATRPHRLSSKNMYQVAISSIGFCTFGGRGFLKN
jgi:hypothetical protein